MLEKPLLTTFLSFIVLALLAICVFLFYVFYGGFSNGFSSDAADWAAFGSYFGGVFGSIVGLGSLVMLLISLMMHENTSVRVFGENQKQSHLRMLDTIYDDIRYLLGRKIEEFELGDYVFGASSEMQNDRIDEDTLRRVISQMLSFVAPYCDGICVYADNISGLKNHMHFEYHAHRRRAIHLLKFIRGHENFLPENDRITLEMVVNTFQSNPKNR